MSRRQRWMAAALAALALVASAAGAAWLARAGLARWLLVRQLESMTGRRATVERVAIDILPGRLAVTGLRVEDLAPGPPLAELDRLDVSVDLRALLHAHVWIREAVVGGVRVRVVRSEGGALNVADLLRGGETRRGSWSVTVDRLELRDGVVSLEDRASTPVRTWRAEGIELELAGVSTQTPDARGTGRLTATMAGSPITADIAELSLAPLHLRGRLVTRDLDATLAGIYLSPGVMGVLERARLSADVAAVIDARDGLRIDARGRLDDLAARNRQTGDPLVAVPSLAFTVDGAGLDAAGRAPRLGRIEVTGAATLFDARGTSAGRLQIDGMSLRIESAGGPTPSSANVTVTAAFADGGGLDVQGPLRLAPLGAELHARITRLDPTVLASYAALPVGLAGVVDGDFTVTVGEPGISGARLRGRATVSRAAVAGGGLQVAIARQIEIEGVDVQWPRVGIARVRMVQPLAVVERDQVGRIPLAALLTAARPPSAETSGGPASGTRPSGVEVAVGEIAVDDGTLTLDDAIAVPPARLTFTRLTLSARDVAWPASRPVRIAFRAATPGAGAIEATGTASLDTVSVDLRARLSGAALAPYQGYVPFAARVEGQAHADLAVAGALAPRVDVTARGTVAMSDLTLGDGDRRVVRVSRIESTGVEYRWPATLVVDRLHVGKSRVRVVRQADGAFPLRALFGIARRRAAESEGSASSPARAAEGPAPSPARDSGPPALSVTVREALLEEGQARLVDEAVSPPASVDLSGVRLLARGFTWPARAPLPIDLNIGTPGGGSASARGTLDLAAAGAELKLALNGVDLSPVRPYLPIKARIVGKASADLDVKARLEPLAVTARGTASLADVTIAEGAKPLVSVARVETAGLDYAWPSRVAIDQLQVKSPRASIERRGDGTFPLAELLAGARTASSADPQGPAPVSPGGATPRALEISVREARVTDAASTVTDATVTPTASFEVAGIRLVARDFTWPSRGDTPVELLVPMPGGGTASASGKLTRGLSGLDLDVTLAGVDVAAAGPYLPVRGRIAGKASAKLALNTAFEPLAIAARGTASLADLAVVDGERRLLTAGLVEAIGLDCAWPTAVSIDRLRVQKAWALIDRVTGSLPVLVARGTAIPPGRPAPRGTPGNRGASEASPLQVSVRRSVIEDGAATIVDQASTPPASLDITGARLVVRDLSWPARGPVRIELRAATPGAGALETRGELRLDASTIDAQLVLDRVDVAALQPFVPLRARLGGKATADLRVKGTLVPLAVTATGRMAVADATLGDGQRSLVTAKGLDLTGLTAEWPRRRATVQRIAVREPWALVERDARGGLPLLALVGAESRDGEPPPAGRGAATAQNGDAPHVEVGALSIEEGFVRFTDRTTSPAFVEEASRLTVTARALSTEPATRSEIAVGARLIGGAQVEMSGHLGPIGGPLFADARGKLSGLALNRMNPYVNGLLGWVARGGSVSGTTEFSIRDDRLEAGNEIVIGQPRFVPSRRGDEVRERVGVPLDLLVSLLEDSRREVRLSVPVTGTLSSHQFDFGDAVWEAIRKAAINVLALPVSWIGKIFYTADARIDTIAIWPVYFEAGTTRLQKGFDAHAERLAVFMARTPAIVYALKPVMTVADVNALKREAVRQRVGALAGQAGQGDAAAVAARLFAERFPGRPVPAEMDAALDELARDEPPPDAALRALAASRLASIRRQLEAKGVDGTRLRASEGAVPVEATGAGRVEFEMIPDAAEAAARG